MVEPHWSITARRFPFQVDYDALWTRSQIRDVFGAQLRVFAPEDLLLILCVCGAKGQWKRLQMICDIAAALGALPHVDAHACLARARRTGTARILLLGCHLAHELLAAEIPEPLREPIRADRALPALARRIVAATLEVPPPAGADAAPWHFSSLIMAMRERPLDKARYFVRTTTTPTGLHLQRMPLPRALHGLYRVLVPLHDFLIQPTWRYAAAVLSRAGFRPRA